MRSTKNALLRVIPTPTCHSDILSGTHLTVQPHSIGSWQKQEAEKVDEEEGGKRGEEEEGGGAVPLLKSRDILTWQVGNGGYTPIRNGQFGVPPILEHVELGS